MTSGTQAPTSDADQAGPIFDYVVDDQARPGNILGTLAELLIDLHRRRSLAERPGAGNTSMEVEHAN